MMYIYIRDIFIVFRVAKMITKYVNNMILLGILQ